MACEDLYNLSKISMQISQTTSKLSMIASRRKDSEEWAPAVSDSSKMYLFQQFNKDFHIVLEYVDSESRGTLNY